MSTVYLSRFRSRNQKQNKSAKIRNIFDKAGFGEFIDQNDLTAVKLHIGEAGCDTFINPIFAREVVERIKLAGGNPFLTDTNTLYSGSRHNGVDHMKTAIAHGFGTEVTGAPFVVADGLRSTNIEKVLVELKHFREVVIAKDIVAADSMLVLSHFKGHEMAGFGGAIKNLAMGCAPALGKKEQHDVKFTVEQEKCVGCGACIKVCPEAAPTWSKGATKKAQISADKCIGCGECLTVCAPKAIFIDWESEIPPFLERMAEYAYGAVKGKGNKVGYINVLANITPDCDCAPWSDAPLVADIGFLSSSDPVALDQACLDLVTAEIGNERSLLNSAVPAGVDKFLHMRPNIDGSHVLEYAEKIGMGSRKYNLVEI